MFHPCYLANTLGASSTQVDYYEDVVFNAGGNTIDSVAYNGEYLSEFKSGSLVEMRLSGIRGHPVHLHVNHFQVYNLLSESAYNQIGDWHDTFLFENHEAPSASVRFYTDYFTGDMVIHCHIASHEDRGMMSLFKVTGNESAV